MKVLIIEDERPASQKLERLIRQIDPGTEIAGIIESVEQATNWLLNNPPPDLIFMDIQLDDGICFEIFENVTIKTPVIFTTAYDEYSLKAFKVNSVDYLLKPVVLEELKNAIAKFREVHHQKVDFAQMRSFISHYQPQTKERFLIRIGGHYRSIQVSRINCFFNKERCSFIHIDKGNNYAVDYSLDKVEELIDPKMFFRVNRNLIVNFTAIQDVLIYSSNRLKIILSGWDEEDEILVSRERVAEFKEWMDR
ncbi:MAG: LytTR family DNA-binding domain-containing protein [Bacteroidales bacterium]|jgi:DNA-binding LytR/AlgR family response regulator|nr:LytTR family DNA-binding domain-containing protein [Bacteroidales bacterium]